MRIDEFLKLQPKERGVQDYSPKLSVLQFNGNLPSLTKLPADVFLQLRSDCIIAAKRNDRLTATAYVSKDSLEAIFKHFKKRVPRAILRLYKYTKWFLIDVDSLETDVIRFYLPAADLDFAICDEFPFTDALEEMQRESKDKPYVNIDLMGFYVSMRDEIVTEYKYYLLRLPNEVHNYRFRKGKFISKHVEYHNLITSEEALADPDFGHLFNNVDLSNLVINLAERQDVNQRYLVVSNRPEGVDLNSVRLDASGGVVFDSKNTIAVVVDSEEEVANTVLEEANTASDFANTTPEEL